MIEPMFRMIWTTVQRNLEAMPEEHFDAKPEGLEMRSYRDIGLHIANSCVTFGDNVGKTVWERVVAFPPETHRTKAQVLQAVRAGGERYLAGLGRLTQQEEARMSQAPWGDTLPQAMLVGFQVPHLFYHNGQLSIYLRRAGVKPLFAAR